MACGGFESSTRPKGWRGENCQWQFARRPSLKSYAFKAEAAGLPEVGRAHPGPPYKKTHRKMGLFICYYAYMENDQPVSNDQNESPEPIQQAPQPQKSIWQKYRLILIAALLVALIITAVLVIRHRDSPSHIHNTVKETAVTSTEKTTAKNENTWVATVDPKALPLGDGKVSNEPKVGYVDSCTSNFRGGGARHAGNWINESAGTWNAEAKVSVAGSVQWPSASYAANASGDTRIVTTADLPLKDTTGIFPIARSDPAYQFDTNPNHIALQAVTLSLPLNPSAANSPNCVGLGYIGVLTNGVLLFNALDDAGRDAAAHETQDTCDGHPDGQERYHYHAVPSCILSRATGSSTLVGYALDGYGIYVERDSKGNLPTNADLDACHGRTSSVTWNDSQTSIYHYDATLEYPYTVGCFHGTPIMHQR